MKHQGLISRLLVCLLAQIPLMIGAQQLTGYEYWFDGDRSNVVTKSLSGYEANINASIPTQQLSDGLHTLYLRVKQAGEYNYSAVTTAIFFKHNVNEGNKIEYWFDDQYNKRTSMALPDAATEEMTDITLNLQDVTKFPMGLHKLNLRLSTEGKSLNSVYSAWVLKLASGDADNIEYWVDDDFENRKTVSGHLSESGDRDFVFVNPFDLSGISAGLHRIYYRATSANGTTNSAVSMATVFVGGGETPKLEYWIDDDRSHIGTLSGHEASAGDKGTIFNQTLNLGNISEGIHRLQYRGINSNGVTKTAISSTPILVKSRYNVENTEDLTVTKQAYWFDDDEPEIISVANPKNIINLPKTFDTRKLTDGQHTLHMQFGNSAGMWNGPVSTTFTKMTVNAPMIAANVSVEDGIVTLKYTAVPYGQRYIVVRKYPSGAIRKVADIKDSEYPAALQATDSPAPGTYTYYVEGLYTDADGEIQRVRSGDMSVTVERIASSVKRGNISGVLLRDGNRIMSNDCQSKVFVNGEPVYDTFLSGGVFTIWNVPYGTELTISVEDSQWNYNDLTLIVNENTCNKTLLINGTKEVGDDELSEDDSFDLFLTRDVHITPDAIELEVAHKSNKQWSGNIIVKMINKKDKEFYNKEISGETTAWDYFWDPNAGIGGVPQYITVANMPIYLPDDKYYVLSLPFIDLPKKTKNEDYEVYVYSVKKDTEQERELKSETYKFPRILTFNPSEYGVAEGFTAYMNSYAQVLKYMKKFSAWGDPFKLAWESAGDGFKKYIENLEKHNWDYSQLNEQVTDVAIKSAGMLLNCFFEDMHKAIKKHTKSIKENEVYRIHEDIYKLYEGIKGVCEASQADDNHKFFEFAKLVLKYTTKDPVVSVYKTYLEVGEKMASTIEQFSNTISGYYIWDRLARGNGIYKIKIRKYDNKGFAGYFPGRDFYQEKGSNNRHEGQIKSINIKLVNQANGVEIESKSFDVELENYDPSNYGIILKNVDFTNKTDFYADNESGTEAWMTITWNNNRITHVPLLNENFVKIENLNKDVSVPLIMTVELQSEANMDVTNIANKITFVKQK